MEQDYCVIRRDGPGAKWVVLVYDLNEATAGEIVASMQERNPSMEYDVVRESDFVGA